MTYYFIWTMKHSYSLSVYYIFDMDTSSVESNKYFLERNPIMRYDQLNTQFGGSSTYGPDDDPYSPDTIIPMMGYIETDSNGNKYATAYVYDNDTGGYHIWLTMKNPPEGFKPGTYNEWLQYEGQYDQYMSFTLTSDKNEKPENPGKTITITGEATTESVAIDYFEASTGYDLSVADVTDFQTTWSEETDGSEFFNSRAILGIFGIPYQFMPHVDPRLDYNKIVNGGYLTDYAGTGREYAHHIVEDMPILFISPGLPNFMTNFDTGEKSSIYDILADFASNLGSGARTNDLLDSTGKYYTFEYAVPEYYKYCNPACRIAAAYMNVATEQVDGTNLESLNWMEYTTKTLSGIFKDLTDVSTYTSIPFYIESDSQITESFSNDVTDSTLASTVDSVSNMGREIMFILGYSNSALGANVEALSNMDDAAQVRESIRGLFGTYAEGNGFIANVINHLTSVATGGKLVFPKIWNDSNFSRSYDVTIKLRSPDMDNLSIYFNIIAPFIHLLCFVLPRQIDDNPNGYYSPFIVRAIYKGFFNIDMGIISSMSVSKGDTGLWNADGIPCSIDVNLSIMDLYDNISMTPTGSDSLQALKYDTLDNTCFMDYIATLCGINIYQPEVGRTLRMWLVNNITNRAADIVNIGLWGNIQNSIANAITNVWRHSAN